MLRIRLGLVVIAVAVAVTALACQGPPGPAGPAGPAGPPGPAGEAGSQGERGEAGAQGLSGPQGLSGTQGERGIPGPQGEAGLQGIRGDGGIQGEVGPAGRIGPRGERGEGGEAGPPGGSSPTATPTTTPTATPTTQPPTSHATIPATPTATPIPATPTATPIPATPTATPIPATPTATPIPATPTATPIPATPTATPMPATPTATPIPATPTATPAESRPNASGVIDLAGVRDYALGLINRDRGDHGLPPVKLGANPAAQMHAEDMLQNDYFGHWWADGRKPYMVYSDTGGMSYVAENAATSGWTMRKWTARGCASPRLNCIVPTVREAVRENQRRMMYDDAHANWGHRDNILGETHRAVNIGIASNGQRVTFVQHFEGGDAVAAGPPVLSSDGRLSFSVSKVAEGVDIGGAVSVYFEHPPTPKTPEQIEPLNSYCVGGGFTGGCGDVAVRVLKPPSPGSSYTGLQSNDVVADKWNESSTAFSFSADLGSRARAPGVYTVTIWRVGAGRMLTEVLVQLSVTRGAGG